MRCSSKRESQCLKSSLLLVVKEIIMVALKSPARKLWGSHEKNLYHEGYFISSPNSYTDAIVIPLILGLAFSLQNPFWISTQSSCWTAAFIVSRREIYHLQHWYWCFFVFPPATHLPAKECSSCCSNFCQSASCSSGKWVTKMRDMLSFHWDRLSCSIVSAGEYVTRIFLLGGCYNFGIPLDFQSVFSCGAQGVHKGSVWTEAIIRQFVEKLEVVVAFRNIDR